MWIHKIDESRRASYRKGLSIITAERRADFFERFALGVHAEKQRMTVILDIAKELAVGETRS